MSSRAAFLFLLAASACGKTDSPTKDAQSSAPSRDVAVAAPLDSTSSKSAALSACPHTGLWALCSVEKRLRQSGFVAKQIEGESHSRAGFSVKPAVYGLGKSRLEVFIYDSEAALARDIAGLDTVLASPRGATVTQWDSTPILVRSANLAVVFLTSNARQAERLTLALTAGAPQPGSPR